MSARAGYMRLSNLGTGRARRIAHASGTTLLAARCALARCCAARRLQPVHDKDKVAARRAGRQALQRRPLSPEREEELERGGQEVRGSRPPASVFGDGAQIADHVGLRLLPGRRVRGSDHRRRKRYVTLHPGSADAAYAQYLIASSYYDHIPDINRDQEAHRTGAAGARRGGAQISDQRICDRRQTEARSRARPARRQGNGDRALLPRAQGFPRRDQPFQDRRDADIRPRARSRKR